MIPKFVLVAEAVLTSILTSLIVEHVYGDQLAAKLDFVPAGFIQSLRASEAILTSVHAGTLIGCAARRPGFRGQLHAKLNLKPGSYSQIPDVTVNRRNSITS